MQETGDFQLERPLGRGATAQVYLARRKSDGARVALKIFHPGLWDQEELRRRAKAEFATVGALKHPGIVQVVQPLFENEPPAVALEYVDGCSLEELQPRLPYILPEVAVLIAIEVLSALEFAHGRGVIHRDLKPANILIGTDGRVLISDFGLARVADVSRVTVTGTILGSPDYMSPEQARGDVARVESDLFSVAAVLYFLVTGTRPFGRHSPLATLAAVLDAQAEQASRRNPKLSPELAALIHRGLSKKPEDRFKTAEEFKKALSDYVAGVGLASELTFAQWMARPTEAAMEAMKAITHTLIGRCEKCIAAGDVDGALGALSHLTLVAPESGAIPRLIEGIEDARRSWKRFVPWISAAAAVLLLGSYFAFRHGSGATDRVVTISAAPAPAQVETREAATEAPRSQPQPRKRSRVTFDVPEGVSVSWDGKKVVRGRGIPSQSTGKHSIRLEKPGSPAINQTVTVTAGEPTVIRVR